MINRRAFVVALAALLAAVGCGSPGERVPNDDSVVDLRVMTFNIEWGGALISFDSVVEAIRRSQADIVGIQEAEGNLRRLAGELGWHYNLRNYAISRFPLLEPPGSDGLYVLVEVQPGKVVALANVHLPSDPYGPDAVRDGATAGEVLAMERRVRLPKIVPYLDVLPDLVTAGMPVFVTGDFNAPSHSDWTDAMVGRRPFLRYALDWPVSEAMTAAGFRDSWRVVHPDPRTYPGLTWWAGRPPLERYAPGDNDAQDRIDFLWYAGPVTVSDSKLVGEEGGPGVSIDVTPWPSDHRAVVSQFAAEPADMPVLVATRHRLYQQGNDVDVYCRGADSASVRIGQLDDAGELHGVVDSQPCDASGPRLAGEELAAGHYVATMTTTDGPAMATAFWVLDPLARPSIDVQKQRYALGEEIGIHWQNGPGSRNDYVAVFAADSAVGYDDGIAWTYVGARPSGQLRLGPSSSETGWPLPPGRYVARLMLDDGYDMLAESAPFSVE